MSTLQEINARDLKRQFFAGRPAEQGFAELMDRQFMPGELGDLLRHHHIRSVSNPAEIAFRDCVDALLDYCGLAEVALHDGYITTSSDGDFWQALHRNLSRYEVKQYYEAYYPQVLPTLLRQRLDAASHDAVDPPSGLTVEFLSHARKQQQDDDLGRFFRLMDSFFFGELTPSQFVEVVQDPARVASQLLDEELANSVITQALRGFDKMILFVLSFDDLLLRCARWRSLESRMWEHFGYWFRAMRRTFGDSLLDAIHSMEMWDLGPGSAESTERNEHFQAVREAVQRVVYRSSTDAQSR